MLEDCAMKKLLALALAVVLTSVAAARVWVTVYQCDGKTPLPMVDANHPDVYRDIMVGTRLTLVIRSDAAGKWLGRLEISQDEALYARLSGRGLTPPPPGGPLEIPTYDDSCLDAAGTNATVMGFADFYSTGLIFDNDTFTYLPWGRHGAYPGDWFVVNYHALQVGDCNVVLSGYDPVGPVVGPRKLLQTLSFTHVASRDFNGDAAVDFKDFAWFAAHWRGPVDPKSGPAATLDLEPNGQIDSSDLASFCEYWLARTDCNEPPAQSGPIAKF